MITFSMLGNHGRLGNQMFQYSLLKSISIRNNFVFAIPKSNHQLNECFNIKCKVYDLEKSGPIIQKMQVFREPSFEYHESVFNVGDNINFIGNFQSEKYFLNIREEILKDFSFKDEIYDNAKKLYSMYKKNRELVSLHVRRGDYVNLQDYHPVCTVEYYKNAVETFGDVDVVCFSDDIEWCKEKLSFIKNIKFSDNTNPYIDLCLMSMCEHNIIANSSFSWWAAWLNKNNNKRVIAPKNWFGIKYNYHNTKDLLPVEWKVI